MVGVFALFPHDHLLVHLEDRYDVSIEPRILPPSLWPLVPYGCPGKEEKPPEAPQGAGLGEEKEPLPTPPLPEEKPRRERPAPLVSTFVTTTKEVVVDDVREVDPSLFSLVRPEVMKSFRILPWRKEGEKVAVITPDPHNLIALDTVRMHFRMPIEVYRIDPVGFELLLDRFLRRKGGEEGEEAPSSPRRKRKGPPPRRRRARLAST